LTSPKTSLKNVLFVEVPYLKFEKSKLSATSLFGNNIDHSIQGKKFRNIYEILDMWHSIQVHSLERVKINKFW
jgi:hypothetical protein